jgi:hypothetical protein
MLDIIEKLETFFPVNPQPIFAASASYDSESEEETRNFLGKRWTHLPCDVWQESERAVFFLSNDSFIYFLPSLIKCSLIEFDKCQLAISNMFFLFINDNHRESRFSDFSIEQLRIVMRWLLEIKSQCAPYPAMKWNLMAHLVKNEITMRT